MSDLLSTIRARIDADLAAATKVVNERQAALTQAKGIQSGLEHVKEAMDRFDAGVYPTDEAAEALPMTAEEEDAAIRYVQGSSVGSLQLPPATREEILRQLRADPRPAFDSIPKASRGRAREHPPGFTSDELQARLALSEAVVGDPSACAAQGGRGRALDGGSGASSDDRAC